jgi:predicted DNA-binding transcriptional regulator AlpA
MSEQLLTKKQVAKKLAISVSHLNRWRDRGTFPVPISVGERAIRWRAVDIDEFVKSLADAK